MSFDKIFDLTAGVYFNFYNIWIFDLQDPLDELMHFLPQLSDFVPLRNGFYSFRAQTA